MRLHILLYISTFLSTSVAAAIQRRDADFLSVRRKLLKDHSGRAGDPPEKYFRMYNIALIRLLLVVAQGMHFRMLLSIVSYEHHVGLRC